MKRFEQINVIPFIDILLVMLAIVLSTASFITQESMNINLPVSKTGEKTNQAKMLLISVERDGVINISGIPTNIERLRETLRATSIDTPIELAVDASVPFSRFVSIIDLLKSDNREHISIATKHDI